MPDVAVPQTAPAEQFRADLTRRVLARLAARTAPLETDVSDGVSDGERFAIEVKRARVSESELADAVDAAIGELFRDGRLLVVQGADAGVKKVVADVLAELPEIVAGRRQALREREVEALVDVFLGGDPLASAMPAIERDNAAARAAFVKRWPVLTAEAIAEQAEHGSSNRSATSSRWKKARRIFGIRASGREVYPAFQFQDGRPRPVIGKVLAALPAEASGWQTAFWFVGANGWLDGKAPIDRLDDTAAVVAAAQRARDEWMG